MYLLRKLVNVENLGNDAKFLDNCLEFNLDKRSRTWCYDNIDNIKVLIAVSGAGKTRLLLELLYQSFGYFYVVSSSHQRDFGSEDLSSCGSFCDANPSKAKNAIKLMHFIRISVCRFLIESSSFESPKDILLAQLHPQAFFGCDIFEKLFNILIYEPNYNTDLRHLNPFPFAVIDEVQLSFLGEELHTLPDSSTLRPFFSPLIYQTKIMCPFTTLLLSGTGINYFHLNDALQSMALKNVSVSYKVYSPFSPLSKNEVESYARSFLSAHNVANVELIVSRLSSFTLCHGRPRFVAYILDSYMQCKNIDVAISSFISGISVVGSDVFPLKFLKKDIDNGRCSLVEVIDGDTLGSLIRDGLLRFIKKGELKFVIREQVAADAIRYGLGFGDCTDGILSSVTLKEAAVIECLRHLIPFADLVKEFVKDMVYLKSF